ncbi:MAG TPA: DegT/DnrJ/EryC1/StrS family aminotransferase [Thermodesulfobacteriota bacterium]|nr:DegT/DnrJ/EryC1/StrS family aminotransferase [Thermodesulfobacteriota bacterium]
MILQNVPQLNGREKEYLLDCLDSNWISSQGKYIQAFERSFAEYCGVRFGLACSSGTSALHLALMALDIGFGDEVIVPDFTLIADANMVILTGARPVFVDVDPDTWCLDTEQLKARITSKTKAIIAVHMFGHPCDMEAILRVAEDRGLFVIEDAAQAHGSEYRGKKAGSLGDVACFSFYASKTLTTGEGGMVLTDRPEIAEKVALQRSHGFEGSDRVYVHRVFGCNYRLTNLQAAIGLAQCERIDEKVETKRRIFETYRQALRDFEAVTFQATRPWARSTYWNVAVLLEGGPGPSCSEVVEKLKAQGIQTRYFFNSLHRQPLFQNSRDPRYPRVEGAYPVSDYLSDHGLCLPSGLNLTAAEIKTVVEALKSCWD